jgi:hypothetical protein
VVDSNPGVLMYSHDSYGLGHLRRTLELAKAFVEHDSGLSVLILTGSTVSGAVLKVSVGFFRRQEPDWPGKIATLLEEAKASLAGRVW